MMLKSEPHVATPRLLLVEPDAAAHDLYRTYLIPRRYLVEHALDGPEALAKAVTDPPDVVVIEARLPGIDGFALCELLRSDPATRSVPLVALTAAARPTVHARLLVCGASSVLVKPCLPETLWGALQTVRPNAPVRVDPPPVEHRIARSLARQHQRYETTVPPLDPPALRCPQCDAALKYVRSHVGGVSVKFSEQWDQYRCPQGCGDFQYRHRTRKVSRLAA
jgi:CheY-like chemotaxis protein